MNEFFKKPLVKVLMLKGEKGTEIASIEKTLSSGLTDTYTLTLSDGRKQTFNVTNGKGIKNIEKESTSGLVDTYKITYNDGTTQNYTVTNGKNGMNADGREVLRTLPNIYIEKNTDLNSVKYLNIGSYTCPTGAIANTLSNVPVKSSFCMYVIAILGGSYGHEDSTSWVYRMRIFFSYDDGSVYIQIVNSNETAGQFNYGRWKKFINTDDLKAITNSEIDTILNS